jgi:hypothetical protein
VAYWGKKINFFAGSNGLVYCNQDSVDTEESWLINLKTTRTSQFC